MLTEQSKSLMENTRENFTVSEALPHGYFSYSSRNSIFRRRSIERIFRPL